MLSTQPTSLSTCYVNLRCTSQVKNFSKLLCVTDWITPLLLSTPSKQEKVFLRLILPNKIRKSVKHKKKKTLRMLFNNKSICNKCFYPRSKILNWIIRHQSEYRDFFVFLLFNCCLILDIDLPKETLKHIILKGMLFKKHLKSVTLRRPSISNTPLEFLDGCFFTLYHFGVLLVECSF